MLLLSGGAAAAAPVPDSPDPELLEFIGQWRGAADPWLDYVMGDGQIDGSQRPNTEEESHE